YLHTDAQGQIDLDELAKSISADTTLIALMWVNNETGLIHPVSEIARIAGEQGVKFHCDGVQALGHIPLQLDTIGVDSLALSGHKIGTPAGIGVLFLRSGTTLQGISFGGGQENNLRAGTQNTLGAKSFAWASEIILEKYAESQQHYESLIQHLQVRLRSIPGIQINRGQASYSSHILNCSFHHVDGEALFIRLDMAKIAVSNGSACSSGSQAPSHVLTAMGLEDTLAQASLRISLGLQTTKAEIDHFCDELGMIIYSIQRDPDGIQI
ncbi:MAG: aminotransferase class V-fold PLP-dependent enzyme, partial [Candidatus Marinimicrobia bacterium]|nr:aminotransferase class V-fold PLP-dependent enzyme [Candidatus Neomarinimicrobiota bacterium]